MPSSRVSEAQKKANKVKAYKGSATCQAMKDLGRKRKEECERKFRSRTPEEIDEMRRKRRARRYYLQLCAIRMRKRYGVYGDRADTGQHGDGISQSPDCGDDGKKL